jgi:hypothetical protein
MMQHSPASAEAFQLWVLKTIPLAQFFQLRGNRKLLQGGKFFSLPAMDLFRERELRRSAHSSPLTKWG